MRVSSRRMLFCFVLLMSLQLLMVHTPQLAHAYTSCDGIETGDVAIVEYEGTKKSNGEVFDSTEGRGPATFTIASDQLIQGFYEGMLGMKIGERKTITVPPAKGYTSPSHELYGETLIFDVYVQTITAGVRDCDDGPAGESSPIEGFFRFLGWVATLGAVGFLGITGYYRLQKTTTKHCAHCNSEGRNRLSEGKCGKCGNSYCRQSFSRGCPNCKSNSFVPNK